MKNNLIKLIIILFFFSCTRPSEKEISGIYASDKVPIELSDGKEYHYLILEQNNIYHLKYNNIQKEGITDSWKILDYRNDTLSVQFHFSNQVIVGKLKGNTFLFEKPNVFDQRFSAWLYVKTNLKSDKILESR